MVFSSLTFLFVFLPVILIVYYLSPKKIRNTILFIGSLIFYAWGEPVYILIMLFSTAFDYVNGILIKKYKETKQLKKSRMVLITSIVVNLGILCFFKYSNFFIENIRNIFNLDIQLLNIVLPIGISFYTFQTMSYTIDVYLGKVEAQKNIIDFGTYVTFFPQLVAGPIIKYRDVNIQLKNRKETIDDFSYGINRLSRGLFKKVILANNIGILWNQIIGQPISEIPVLTAWFGAICFSFQIYFDFSGYSDMAIGLGRMFGFHFPENFDHPYTSKSITEFWRRWHISLGTWFKEYVYIPLGGSKKGRKRLVINLLIVWTLTGLWHGASWNFVIWGVYFGVLLIIEKLILEKYLEKLPSIFRHIYTMFFVVISWIIFAFDDMTNVCTYLKAMFGMNNTVLLNRELLYMISTHALLIIICILASTTFMKKININKDKNWYVIIRNLACMAMFFISVCFLIGSTYNPFLYFRF